jgi:hypothetical protein
MRLACLLWLLAMCMGACGLDKERITQEGDQFYDLKGLVDQQISELQSAGLFVFKEAQINDSLERVRFEPDSAGWQEELAPFRDADINKPVLANSFVLEEHNTNDGLFLRRWITKVPEETLVDTLSLFFADPGQAHPLRITASVKQSNILFQSRKLLELTLARQGGKPVIEAYTIAGWQKMQTKDTTRFAIRSRIGRPGSFD